MVKKRIVGVVTIKDKWVVQSFGYKKYLPIGKPECIIENLDRWGADEILIQVIDRSVSSQGPDFELLSRIGKLSLATPIIYAGGIRDVNDAINVIKNGADRLVVDFILRNKTQSIYELASSLGSQAIIASLPVHKHENEMMIYNYDTCKSDKLNKKLLDIISDKKNISEILIINKDGEGYSDTFDINLLKAFTKIDISFIAFGGIHGQDLINKLLNHENISAVAIGNFLNYKEHSIQSIKGANSANNIRKPDYLFNI
jgi:cyclase